MNYGQLKEHFNDLLNRFADPNSREQRLHPRKGVDDLVGRGAVCKGEPRAHWRLQLRRLGWRQGAVSACVHETKWESATVKRWK